MVIVFLFCHAIAARLKYFTQSTDYENDVTHITE